AVGAALDAEAVGVEGGVVLEGVVEHSQHIGHGRSRHIGLHRGPQLRVRPPDPRGFEYTTAKPAEVSTWVSSNQEWVYWEKGPPWMLTMTGYGPCPRGFASHPVMVPPSPGTRSTSGTTEFAGAGCCLSMSGASSVFR